MRRHETTEDFKERLAAILRDKNAPEPILGAARAHPSLVRKSSYPARKRKRNFIDTRKPL